MHIVKWWFVLTWLLWWMGRSHVTALLGKPSLCCSQWLSFGLTLRKISFSEHKKLPPPHSGSDLFFFGGHINGFLKIESVGGVLFYFLQRVGLVRYLRACDVDFKDMQIGVRDEQLLILQCILMWKTRRSIKKKKKKWQWFDSWWLKRDFVGRIHKSNRTFIKLFGMI